MAINHQAAFGLSRLETKVEDQKPLHDEVLILTFSRDYLISSRDTDYRLKIFRKGEGPFVFLTLEDYVMGSTTDNGQAKLTRSAKSIGAQSTNAGQQSGFESVDKPSTSLNVDSNEVLKPVFHLDGVS